MKTNTTSFAAGPGRWARALSALLLLALGLGTAPKAFAGTGFFGNFVILNGTGTPNGARYYYRLNSGGGTNAVFQNSNLGTYDRNTGSLLLDGAETNTFEDNLDVVNQDSTILFFRLYKQTAANGDAGQGYSFQPVRLPQVGPKSGNNRRFETTTAFITRPAGGTTPINLVRFTSGPGVYVVELFVRAAGVRNGGAAFREYDSNNSADYRATFTISGTDTGTGAPLVGQPSTTWLGGVNPGSGCNPLNPTGTAPTPVQQTEQLVVPSQWFDPLLWSNGVPTEVTDTDIPNYSSTPCVVYPNIRTTAQTGPALTKNLAVRGTTASNRAIARLLVGELRIYGDFTDASSGYIQRAGTTFAQVGPRDQAFNGSNLFANVKIDGLAGGIPTRKTLSGTMTVSGTLTFVNGVLVTGIANPDNTNVRLATSTSTTPGGRLAGEGENNFVEGYVISTELAQTGITQAFGNIGLDLTFTGPGQPGNTEITRATGFSAGGLLGSKPSIKRTYGIRPANTNSLSNPLVARVGVRYLDRELVGAEASTGGPFNLDETQLTVWFSTSGGTGFQNQGRDRINTTGNRVTANNLTTFATTTLGENSTSLPVNFTYFTAVPDKIGAILNWGTALEKDNAGFEVQVSLDGREFRTLTTVRPASANSNTAYHYSYLDATASSGTRYYRLRQVDTDGTFTFTPVRVVNFGGTAAAAVTSTSSVFPNPFHDGEQLVLNVRTAVAGTATVRVMDALGREVARQTAEVSGETAAINLPSLDTRPAGVYLVRLSLPSGATQTIKIQKQ